MRKLIVQVSTIFFCAVLGYHSGWSQSQGQQRPQSPCLTSSEFRQLDFWIGEWEVHNPKGQLVGTSSVQLILGKCVIFENWTGAKGGTGKSFNVYNAVMNKWQQFWVDASGTVVVFSGEFKDGAMRYESVQATKNGGKILGKMTYFPLPEGKVRQLWEQSNDEGKTWTTNFDGVYSAKK
ncbi:MAG: hypothetical protein HY276_02885 [Ignavibacteriales bacterium]|nr:hypothetical protein [Ignavibacteriales bacterium]